MNDVCINSIMLSQWLERLTNYDWSDTSIHALLHPKDPQDVPRAVLLLCCVAELRDIDQSNFNPSERIMHNALCLLGDALEALVEPFINPTLSLSQQITHLVKFAHIACALFIKHGTSFLSNQLYGDLQCLVKNAIFQVARTQMLNPILRVFLCLLGDDVLETLFGRIRMIGAHSPNVDIVEFENRTRRALNMGDIYSRWRVWERKPERLKLLRQRDSDHMNPENWTKDNVAGDCDLLKSCELGIQQALESLKHAGISIDFNERFSRKGYDLMRPNGGDSYPGVSKEVDRSLEDVYSGDDSLIPVSPSSESDPVIPNLSQAEEFLSSETNQPQLNTSPVGNPSTSPCTHSIFMKIDDMGNVQHKKTILRIVFDSTHDIDYAKTHDRLLRVRYFSIGGDSWDRKGGLKLGEGLSEREKFKIGGLFATLIRVNGTTVGIAIAQTTIIKTGSKPNGPASSSIASAPLDEITLPSSSYEISGQLLSLTPITLDLENKVSWIWDGKFVAFEAVKARQSSTPRESHKKRELNFIVPATLIIPISSDSEVMEVDIADLPGNATLTFKEGMDTTWVVTDTEMTKLRAELWKRVNIDGSSLQTHIPTYGRVLHGVFPYQSSENGKTNTQSSSSSDADHLLDDTLKIVQQAGTLMTEAVKSDERLKCRICLKDVAGGDRQNHMGKHILYHLQRIEDPTAQNPVSTITSMRFDITLKIFNQISSDYPCGFCGESSSTNGKCTVSIAAGGKAASTCPDTYRFAIAPASKISKQKPCTNVPIRCAFCVETHWKYNMENHLRERHPSWKNDPNAGRVSKQIEVSQEEHRALGIISLDDSRTERDHRTPDPSGSKRVASSPPGTPITKSKQGNQQRKTRKVSSIMPRIAEPDSNSIL